ncbi:AbiV family abortive infection protein [Agrobacterium sp. ES01]|uniref:AbiV family abortive infection protein n=1 Tax=Agrobacterium sp. ES01 TaxID=3420714 RepID=UPI003D14D8D8
MTRSRSQFESDLLKSIKVCIANCDRLIEETYNLEFRKPPSTRMYLSMIAQEEAAKAFMLFLVKEDIIPFTKEIRRAIRDHTSKQLVGVLMDYMIMHWDDIGELDAAIAVDLDSGDQLPVDVRSAVELLCYEKVGKWMGHNWIWTDEPEYDKLVQKIADGHTDRRKQSALYVNIGSTGQVSSTPDSIDETETVAELAKASRYSWFAERLVDNEPEAIRDKARFEKVMASLRLHFGTRWVRGS